MKLVRSILAGVAWTALLAGCGGGGPGDGGSEAAPQDSRAQALATPPGAVAPRYRVINLDLPGATNEQVFRMHLNASGQLIGTAVDPLGDSVAFRYDPAAAIPLQRLDLSDFAGEIRAMQINADGEAVFNVTDGTSRAVFVDEAGQARAIPPLVGGGFTRAFGLNAQAMVVGESGGQGFAWTPAGGTVAAFPPGVPFSVLEDVNDPGLALGRTSLQEGAGFNYLYSAATGAVRSSIFADMIAQRVNNAGVFAGFSGLNLARIEAGVLSVLPEFTPFGVEDFNERSDILAFTPLQNGLAGFLVWFGEGTLAKPNPIEADVSLSARALNNDRLVVGDFFSVSGGQRAFAWNPASGFVTLQSRLPAALQGLQLFTATAVNDAGIIVVESSAGLLLLVPDDGAPAAAATVSAIMGPELVSVQRSVALRAAFMDVNVEDTHTARWSWGDGSTSPGTVHASGGKGFVTGTHSYKDAGVYTVTLTVADSTGRKASVSKTVVAFDADGGFVTGSGWLYSPHGAYRADPSIAGRASFHFVSKYKKGRSEPSGKTRFVFQAANLNFVSVDYDWLVVAGAKAQYRGTGRYNGLPGYKFVLTARDGRHQKADRFRIRIWHHDAQRNRDVLDYDNQIDLTTEGTAIEGTVIGGGNIVVHK